MFITPQCKEKSNGIFPYESSKSVRKKKSSSSCSERGNNRCDILINTSCRITLDTCHQGQKFTDDVELR
ncbi:hypothetical protein Aduo_011153 [Ancylostoma duodenale]